VDFPSYTFYMDPTFDAYLQYPPASPTLVLASVGSLSMDRHTSNAIPCSGSKQGNSDVCTFEPSPV
jgi:hypothetical protein